MYHETAFTIITRIIRKYTTGKECLIIAVSRTFDVAAEEVVDSLGSSGLNINIFIIPDPLEGSPATDDKTKNILMEETETLVNDWITR